MTARHLLTARLRLDAVALDDLAAFHALHTDPDLYRHAPQARHPDLEHSRSVLEGYVHDWDIDGIGYYSARLRPVAGQAAGGDPEVYLGCGGLRATSGYYNVYYRVHSRHQGHGFATDIVRAAARELAAREPDALIQAAIRPWNGASRRVADKLGLQFCLSQPDLAGIEQVLYQASARRVAGC